jgi:hypothetical protein
MNLSSLENIFLIKLLYYRLGRVAHAYGSSYMGGRGKRLLVLGWSGETLYE